MNKFDFFMLAAHGAGAHSLFRYLQAHPQILPARTGKLAFAAQHPISALTNGILPAGKYRSGWLYAAPNMVISDPSIPEKIKANTKPHVMIQLVRDPIRLVLSIYNQHAQKSLMGILEKQPEIEEAIQDRVPYCRFYEAGRPVGRPFRELDCR